MQNIETDFLILGAGWSGLVAAECLSRNNKRIVILEKENEAGGLARTFDFGGFKFDIGGHALFFKKAENFAYLKSLSKNGSLVSINRKAKMFFNNKYLDFPPNISSILRLGLENIVNISLDFLRLDKTNEKKNFEEWAKSNYGDNLYKIYFKEYSEKVWGSPCRQLSAGWANRRIGDNSLTRVIGNFVSKKEYGKEGGAFFYYPLQGIGTLPGLLEKAVAGSTCKLYKGARIDKILMSDNRLNSLNFIYKEKIYNVTFKHIISSIPLVEFIKLLAEYLSEETVNYARGIRYRNLILVNILIPKDLVTDWHWCYFPSKDLLFSRLHEPKFWSKNLAPDNNTMLCTEIFCDYGDAYWQMSEDTLAKKIIINLKNLKLLAMTEEARGFLVKKIEYAYPLLYEGFEQPLQRVKESLRAFDNLVLIGRNGTHSYFDMEDCLEDTRKKIYQTLSGDN
jgi:protoporphyrinogen oxidase